MLAVGPAWHPLPFPSSPCLGHVPARTPPSPHPSRAPPAPPPTPPFPPSPTFQWNCKEDQNKERGLFFTLLSLRSNDITSAASSPRIPDAQRIFPLCREPSILFEFLHFIPTSTKGLVRAEFCSCQVIWKRHSPRNVFQKNPSFLSENRQNRKQLT